MHINIDISALFSNRTSRTLTASNHNAGQVQVITPTLDKNNNLQQVKKILANNLYQSSAQSLNSLYQSAQDSRIKVYIDNEEKEVYESFVDRVTQHINIGKASGESSEQLNGLLQRISQGSEQAHTETRQILAALGKLDADTESYIAQSSTYTRFAINELESKISDNQQFDEINGNKKEFSLQVTTREGDQIDINIKQAANWQSSTYANKISVNYEVEGHLSESEKIALSELINAIGSASDSLLAGNDLTQLMGIDNFNGQQLNGFSLALNGSDQKVNYSYQHDDSKQTLTGEWTQEGEVKAQFKLQSQLGGNSDSEQLARYLDLLDQASESSYKHNDDKDQSDQTSTLFSNTFSEFMQLAESLGKSLTSVDQQFSHSRQIANHLFNETIKNQSNRLGLKDEQQASLKEGFNQLADFSASFVAQKGGISNQNKDNLQTGYDVNLTQKTSVENRLINGEQTTAIKQSQTASFDAVMQGDLNSRTSQYNEQYQIMAAFDKQQLKGFTQSRNISEQNKENIYHGLGESRFTEIDKNTESKNNLYLLKEGILENSNLQGFENIKKGFKAGDAILSEIQSHHNYQYQTSLFTPSEASFQNNQQTQLSIASQKQLLDEILDKL